MAVDYVLHVLKTEVMIPTWDLDHIHKLLQRFAAYILNASEGAESQSPKRCFFFPHLDTLEFLYRVTVFDKTFAKDENLYGIDWRLPLEELPWMAELVHTTHTLVTARAELEQRLLRRHQTRAAPPAAVEPGV